MMWNMLYHHEQFLLFVHVFVTILPGQLIATLSEEMVSMF